MKKVQIHQFDPVIYPTRLWVGIRTPFNEVFDKFWGLNDDLEKIIVTEEQYTPDRFVIARTYNVCDKESKFIGNLVIIWQSKQFSIKSICHESAHCADFICEQFGINSRSFKDGEAYAYLIGWIADCINQVRLNKFKGEEISIS